MRLLTARPRVEPTLKLRNTSVLQHEGICDGDAKHAEADVQNGRGTSAISDTEPEGSEREQPNRQIEESGPHSIAPTLLTPAAPLCRAPGIGLSAGAGC